MTKLLKMPNGEEHGLIKKLANSVPDDDFKSFKPEDKEKAIKVKKEDHRIVKARYINHRGAHERLTKPYCRWAGDPIETWHFIPDQTYEVPKGLVDEVNNNPGLPKRSEIVDAQGVPTRMEGKAERLHEFVPVGF